MKSNVQLISDLEPWRIQWFQASHKLTGTKKAGKWVGFGGNAGGGAVAWFTVVGPVGVGVGTGGGAGGDCV